MVLASDTPGEEPRFQAEGLSVQRMKVMRAFSGVDHDLRPRRKHRGRRQRARSRAPAQAGNAAFGMNGFERTLPGPIQARAGPAY